MLMLGSLFTPSANQAEDYYFAQKLIAVTSGIIDTLSVYSRASGNVKVGLYADSGGSPVGPALVVNNSGVACSSFQWNNIAVADTEIEIANDYWIIAVGDTNGVVSRNSSTGTGISGFSGPGAYTAGIPSSPPSLNAVTYVYGLLGYGDPDSVLNPAMMMPAF
jgi:hypothetical protein